MPEYSRPNLSIPSALWGEVKVAAFRRGVRPVEVVIELLREKFDEHYMAEKGLPSRASVRRLKDKVESIGDPPPTFQPTAPPVVSQKQPVSEFSCKVCGKPTDGAYVCKGCVDNQKNQQ